MREKASEAEQIDQRKSGRDASVLSRQLLAGFLSGASAVIGVMLFLAVLLFVGILGPLIYDIASGLRGEIPFWSTLGQVLGQSLLNLPRFIWNGRWVIVGFGLVGVLLCLAASQARRIERPWRGMVSFVAALGLVGAIVFGYQYSNREVLLAWLAGQPFLLNAQYSFLLSNTASLSIGLMVALMAAYIIWGLWNWWYARWSRWLGLEQAQAPAPKPAVAPAESSWQAEQARLHRSKRGLPNEEEAAAPSAIETTTSNRLLWRLLALVAAATLALLVAVQFYNLFESQLGGGDLFVSTQSPADSRRLDIRRAPRQLIVSSIDGQGSIDIALANEQQTDLSRRVEGMQLTDIGNRSAPSAIMMEGLPIGHYRLDIRLRNGSGGQIRYMLLQGGGTWAQVTAWLVGLAAGIWLMLVTLATLEFLTVRGWFKTWAV